MDLSTIIADAPNLSERDLIRRLDSVMLRNYKYKNLDKDNRKIVYDIIKKYSKYIRRGVGISHSMLRREIYNLRRNRIKLNLDEPDLDDIEDILNEFRG